MEFFDLTHKRMDGTYVKDKTELLRKATEMKIEKLRANGSSSDQHALESEAWTFYMGDDRPSRARGCGIGVTRSQAKSFRADLMRMRYEELNRDWSRVELQNLHNKLVEQKHMFDQHVASTIQIITELKSEVQLYRVAFGSQMYSGAFGMFGTNPMAGANDYAYVPTMANTQAPKSASADDRHVSTDIVLLD
ncbi:hypothetical protein Cgig2_018411 [Carnegiea gigantea]|uniref:Uncharacterized protein n=1 Tax=Carnegiea gigantea TaxID=171969 RepID=A0A9Q1GXV2_9CARY|nr:hypothetical protein Cgig2_018411 [Carnegiea gigantea]